MATPVYPLIKDKLIERALWSEKEKAAYAQGYQDGANSEQATHQYFIEEIEELLNNLRGRV